MTWFKLRAGHKEAHEQARKQIEESRAAIVDMAARLARLEAEVYPYQMLYKDKGSS